MTLYNAHTSTLGILFITKWDSSGNVESSYETSYEACTCPAGHRHTCRHRQMLPLLIPIANTHWFLDWDNGRQVVDFSGIPKSHYDRMTCNEPEATTSAEGIHVEEDTALAPVGSNPTMATIPWRRI